MKEETIEYYMREGCGYFAIALQEIFDYKIYALLDYSLGEKWGKKFYPLIAHVFCSYKNNVIDIKGIRSINEVKDDFYDLEEPIIEEFTVDELKEIMGENKPLYAYNLNEINDAEKIIKNNIDFFTANKILKENKSLNIDINDFLTKFISKK